MTEKNIIIQICAGTFGSPSEKTEFGDYARITVSSECQEAVDLACKILSEYRAPVDNNVEV